MKNLPLGSVRWFTDAAWYERKLPSRHSMNWVILTGLWQVCAGQFSVRDWFERILAIEINLAHTLNVIKWSPMGWIYFHLFFVRHRAIALLFIETRWEGVKKNWDFNFYINIASSLIRIKVQIQRYQLCVACLEVFLFLSFSRVETLKIFAGGGFQLANWVIRRRRRLTV